MKTIIEIHALQNFAPSNLNRDDTGAPKDAIFGGTRRARISSQCMKRAIRNHFKDLVAKGCLDETNLADRTKRLLDLLVTQLEALGHPGADAKEKAKLALASVKLTVKEDDKTQYLLFLGHREIRTIAEIIHNKWDSITALEEGASPSADGKKEARKKKDAAKQADPELKKALEDALDGGRAMDIALFGPWRS